MSLAEARTAAFERWKIAKGGGDPRKEEAKVASPTFAEAAEAVIAIHEPSWRSPKSGPQWRASLETYAYPVIGELPVSEVMPGQVMAVLEPIWNEKRETARRVKQRISAICRWAVAQGYRTDDPAGIVIDAALPRNGVERRHMRALPYDEVADCIAQVKSSRRASHSSKLALEFPGTHCGAFGRGAQGDLGRDGCRGRDLDGTRFAHEGEPGAPGAAVRAGARGSGRSGGAFGGRRAGVPWRPAGPSVEREHAREAAARAWLRRRHARFPVELPRLRGGADAPRPTR